MPDDMRFHRRGIHPGDDVIRVADFFRREHSLVMPVIRRAKGRRCGFLQVGLQQGGGAKDLDRPVVKAVHGNAFNLGFADQLIGGLFCKGHGLVLVHIAGGQRQRQAGLLLQPCQVLFLV